MERFYRDWVGSDLITFKVREGETDVLVSANSNLEKETLELVRCYRQDIIDYIKINPEFQVSLKPLAFDEKAPLIIKSMLDSSIAAGVGPMAAIAGAISEFVGKELLKLTGEVIVENGGDIFIKTDKERNMGIYAGESPLTGNVRFKIKPKDTPLGICTSSGTVGHSLSFGMADAVCVISKTASLADAVATATANIVKTERDITKALNFAKGIEGITGCVVIYKNKIGSIGEVELV